MAEPQVALPYGAWSSPITARSLVSGASGVSEVVADGDDIWWVESRPEEGGRNALIRWRNGTASEVTAPDANVRTLVHEYGGGSWWVDQGVAWYSEFADQRLRKIAADDDAAAPSPVALTPAPATARGLRYADGRPTPDHRWYVCVRERHDDGGHEPSNEIVAVACDGSERVEVLVSGPDFVANPRLSPDGSRLAWVQWNHPDMPWDVTELWTADFTDGSIANSTKVAGNGNEAIVQPQFTSDGRLLACTDRHEWWNLFDFSDPESPRAIDSGSFEIGEPAWVFNMSKWASVGTNQIVVRRQAGRDTIVDLATQAERHDWSVASSMQPCGDGVTFVAATQQSEPAVVRWIPGSEPDIIRPGRDLNLDAGFLPDPESITFPTSGGAQAHALYYAPANPSTEGTSGELPPLLVLAHGGPTGSARNQLQLGHRFWTSRGIAVVDVDYRGSTGYGRAYRHSLFDAWGLADVDDCVAAAQFLVDRGDVDGDRLLIKGGSAGGFTVLCGLTFHDVFAAGASRYGIADLAALASDTHKFEARYLDRLVGPWPAAESVYTERSPIHHTERLSCPIALLQGSEDAVVPPNQAELMASALDAKRLPYAHVVFEGEQHGFRSADNIVRALEVELSFFGQILGFDPADDLVPVEVQNLAVDS